jgi:uracil-DNA glycosylase
MSEYAKKPAKPATFAEALMGDLTLEALGMKAEDVLPAPVLTEKAVVLESFARFAQEKIEESPTQSLQFDGGEIVKREDPNSIPYTTRFANRAQWEAQQRERLGERAWNTLSQNKKPLVLFVGEALQSPTVLDTPVEGVRTEFSLALPLAVADLFQKMVYAMKLTSEEYVLSALSDAKGERTAEDLLEEIHWWSPAFVVPLGAQATQAILGSRERLAMVHGKFFPAPRMPESKIQIAPLFHPSVIASNANMKKATWTDMQKIMQALGKI